MPVKIAGRVPRDRDAMLSALDEAIEESYDGRFERYRASIANL